MLNNWFYSHPTWAVAALVCSALILLALLGLFLFHRLVDWQSREHDTPMVGLSYALCGSVYTVLLAFVAVGTYETMEKTATITANEADALGGIAFDTAGLPQELAVRVRADVNKYLDIVTNQEWPAQRAYRMEPVHYEEGWAQVRRLSLDVASFEPATQGQATVKVEMEHTINELFGARRARLLAANAHLPNAVWQMLIFGFGLLALYVYLFGPHSFRIHMAVTSLTMLSIGLVFTLVIALDYPFRGELSVSDEAYRGVREVADHVFEAQPAARERAAVRAPEK